MRLPGNILHRHSHPIKEERLRVLFASMTRRRGNKLLVLSCASNLRQESPAGTGAGITRQSRIARMVPKLCLGTPVREAPLREPACKALDGGMSLGKQSFPGIHSQAELGSDTAGVRSVGCTRHTDHSTVWVTPWQTPCLLAPAVAEAMTKAVFRTQPEILYLSIYNVTSGSV
jgi:hypothetical protein